MCTIKPTWNLLFSQNTTQEPQEIYLQLFQQDAKATQAIGFFVSYLNFL